MKPYIFVIFQGGPDPLKTPSGSAHGCNPGTENLNVPMLLSTGCHVRAVQLYIGCIGIHAGIIRMLKRRHHVMSHLSVFRNFWEFFKHKMRYLMLSKTNNPLLIREMASNIRPS